MGTTVVVCDTRTTKRCFDSRRRGRRQIIHRSSCNSGLRPGVASSGLLCFSLCDLCQGAHHLLVVRAKKKVMGQLGRSYHGADQSQLDVSGSAILKCDRVWVRWIVLRHVLGHIKQARGCIASAVSRSRVGQVGTYHRGRYQSSRRRDKPLQNRARCPETPARPSCRAASRDVDDVPNKVAFVLCVGLICSPTISTIEVASRCDKVWTWSGFGSFLSTSCCSSRATFTKQNNTLDSAS